IDALRIQAGVINVMRGDLAPGSLVGHSLEGFRVSSERLEDAELRDCFRDGEWRDIYGSLSLRIWRQEVARNLSAGEFGILNPIFGDRFDRSLMIISQELTSN